MLSPVATVMSSFYDDAGLQSSMYKGIGCAANPCRHVDDDRRCFLADHQSRTFIEEQTLSAGASFAPLDQKRRPLSIAFVTKSRRNPGVSCGAGGTTLPLFAISRCAGPLCAVRTCLDAAESSTRALAVTHLHCGAILLHSANQLHLAKNPSLAA